jgi:RHS repeat-associated protein
MAVHVQWLWDVRYIDAPVLRWRDADADPQTGLEEVLYYANDANMNVTALVDATPGSQTVGQVVERYVYDAYGRATVYNGDWSAELAWTNSRKNEVTYCGYRFDAETQLHHVRFRYYHTTTGAWASRDPAGYVDGASLLQYVRSSPSAAIDPTGLSAGLDPKQAYSLAG